MTTVDPTKIREYCHQCSAPLEPPARGRCLKCIRKAQNIMLRNEIPPRYLTTDRSQLPAKLLQLIDNFDISSDEGLYLSGPVGRYKTRAACLLLERYCHAGNKVAFVSSTKFAQLVRTQFHDDEYTDDSVLGGKGKSTGQKSRERLKQIRHSTVLLLDDVGKEKRTDRVETELFDLLEYRTSEMLPTLYTSNYAIVDLENRFNEQGLAIMRRITEFNLNVEV
jgi:DNA replication protein DnaC